MSWYTKLEIANIENVPYREGLESTKFESIYGEHVSTLQGKAEITYVQQKILCKLELLAMKPFSMIYHNELVHFTDNYQAKNKTKSIERVKKKFKVFQILIPILWMLFLCKL